MSKIIVTGGAGFIGSHLVDALVEQNHDVIVIDNFSTGSKKNLEKSRGKVKILKTSLLIEKILKRIPKVLNGTDYIFHLAALPRIERSINDPIGTHQANVEGTIVALELARQLGVKKFLFVSSSSVYGIQKRLPLFESLLPNPQNTYAYQKLMGEYYSKIYNQMYNLEVIIFRLFNVYGPRMFSKGSYKLVFTKWLEQIRSKQPLTIYGKGDQTRDFTSITDVVRGLILGMTTELKNQYEILNLGGGQQKSIREMAKLFKNNVQFLPPRPYEEKFKEADINKAKKLLNWKPSTSIDEGIKKLLNYYTIYSTTR
ncbi:NAD-dependent epimerase/dehydratase family protein [Patescibacteria group bacterium]|nr:NAD-dependent epimerase/dehydratase family protein [Patescibacteria group bacterium]